MPTQTQSPLKTYLDHLERDELAYQFSPTANRAVFYPRVLCPFTGSDKLEWRVSAGKGTVTATYDPATKVLTWEGNFSGLSGPATAAHFHGPAEVGKNASPAVWISEKGQNLASPFKGTATLTDAQADDLQKGLWYANVHTEANKGGEIRGQVVKG